MPGTPVVRRPRSTPCAPPGRCRILVTSAWFEPGFRGGGPIRSVAHVVDTVTDSTDITLVTSDRDLGDRTPYAGVSTRGKSRGRSAVHYLDVGSARAWWALVGHLRRQRFDLLYANSLFDPCFTIVPLLAARLGLLRVRWILIAPRGELSSGALSLKAAKKRAVLLLLRPLLRGHRVEWHASSVQEAAEIVAVLPAATVLTAEVSSSSLPARAELPPDGLDGALALVFLSRIAPKKNLDLVIRSMSNLARSSSLDVYGPIEDHAYWATCLAHMAALPPHVRVAYCGEVPHADVRSTFARYDAFVFPTLGENFGHVIAESLSASCGVICSRLTPWTAVLERGGGSALADLSVDTLTRELESRAAQTPAERAAARRQVATAYDEWRSTAKDVNVLDEWRLRRCEPTSVR